MQNQSYSLENIIQGIEGISSCEDDASLNELVRALVAPFGATSHIFTSILCDDGQGRENHRFLIGCKPQLCQFYNGRKWFMNDPCIIYARSNNIPIAISDIPFETPQQNRLLHETFPTWGFRSGLVVPAHGGLSNRIGIFYIGSDEVREIGNPKLMRHRILLQVIAVELANWWANRVKQDLLKKFGFTETHLKILRLQKKGFNAPAIAGELRVSARTVHNKVREMKDALQVDNIREGCDRASLIGLI